MKWQLHYSEIYVLDSPFPVDFTSGPPLISKLKRAGTINAQFRKMFYILSILKMAANSRIVWPFSEFHLWLSTTVPLPDFQNVGESRINHTKLEICRFLPLFLALSVCLSLALTPSLSLTGYLSVSFSLPL